MTASIILEPQRATQLQLGLNLQGMRGGLGATSPASAMAANGVCLPTEPLVLYPTATLPPALCVAPSPAVYPLHTLVCARYSTASIPSYVPTVAMYRRFSILRSTGIKDHGLNKGKLTQ